jgi:hypothetical protein
MMKYTIILLIIIAGLLTVSCENVTGVKKTDFAIYTLKNTEQSLSEVAGQAVEEVPIAKEPVIHIHELHNYDWNHHAMTLAPRVGEMLEGMVHPDSSTNEHPFVLMAGGERIYMGAFMPAWSSLKPNMPHIILTSTLKDSIFTLTIHSSAERNGDVREDMRIYEALKAAGKLVE